MPVPAPPMQHRVLSQGKALLSSPTCPFIPSSIERWWWGFPHCVSKSEKAPLESVAVAFSGHYSFLGLSLCEMLTALLVLHGSRERCADENPQGDVAPHNRAARRSLQSPCQRMKMWLNGKRLLSLGVHKNKNLVS